MLLRHVWRGLSLSRISSVIQRTVAHTASMFGAQFSATACIRTVCKVLYTTVLYLLSPRDSGAVRFTMQNSSHDGVSIAIDEARVVDPLFERPSSSSDRSGRGVAPLPTAHTTTAGYRYS